MPDDIYKLSAITRNFHFHVSSVAREIAHVPVVAESTVDYTQKKMWGVRWQGKHAPSNLRNSASEASTGSLAFNPESAQSAWRIAGYRDRV